MLKCGLLNVRSAVNKAPLLNEVIQANNLDVFIITETWVPSDAPNAIKYGLAPEGYSILLRHHGSSQDKRGGGPAVVHSNLLKATLIVDDMKYLGLENLTVKFNTYSSSFIISSIYRPPGHVSTDFINEFSDHVGTIINFNIQFIICGDFNAPGQLKVIKQHLESTIEALALFQHVNSSTHSHGNILDLVITSIRHTCIINNVGVMDCVFFDHSLVTFDTRLSKPKPPVIVRQRRSYRRFSSTAFQQELSDAFYDILSRGDYDVDDLTSAILTSTTNLLDKHAPFRRLSLRGSNRPKHQLSIGAINAIRICRRLERQSKRFCSEIIKTEYKKAKEIAKTLIMQFKIDSIKEELHSKSKPRDLWRSLNNLLLSRPPQHYSDDECQILVNSFTNDFISKINNIHQSIKDNIITDNITPFKHRPQSTNIFDAFSAVSVSEVLKLTSSLDNKTLTFCLLFFSKNFLHSLLL
ncbi:hypothetical protein HELRODRAFT_172856 [Helobdella robusta]|uniref:Endonuclease/exonuclease/phosphatase domain-containing protein n=1 Tax=Helobdella robusta TaxID=6412 RepID=T1F608_HELRO|nr:hypothetical protein HELRODRAFT_172856 [Helobdella robusta]ESO04469.1 hypothetical protein HELRODRAFT_172856 [Helobdella robusta]